MIAKNSNRADRIHRGWPVVEICGLIAALVLFNAFPEWIGVLVSADDLASFVPLLTPAFQVYLPWLNIWWGLALCLAYAKLFYGRWTMTLRWADLGLCVLRILVLARFLLGGPIVGLNREEVPFLDLLANSVLVLALIGAVVELVQRLVNVLARLPAFGGAPERSVLSEYTSEGKS
jgi:hypothetical protein